MDVCVCVCEFCLTKALLSLWSYFPNILYPPQWEISRHKHIMTGRDESSLKFLVARENFPTLDVSILCPSTQGYLPHPCAVLTRTSDWHQRDFPTTLKGKVLFVPAERRTDRLVGRLCPV